MGAKVPQIEGVAIRGFLSAVERVCPPGTRKRMLAKLPDQVGPAVEHESFLAAGWYPPAHLRSSFGAFVLSPEFLIRRTPGLFNRYYDTGTFAIPEARAGVRGDGDTELEVIAEWR
ncbi:MAG TPA: hypothetical protein VGL86_33900 [Polyangia bacterium]|jgi:hypothetical protein